VEKNVSPERVVFLKSLLEFNHYTVIAVPSPPPKAAPVKEGEAPPPSPPETYTIGVTDVTFNATNAIFGRLLHSRNRHIVTLAYWQQKDKESHDEIPYYEQKIS
jgi:hypothetical protein